MNNALLYLGGLLITALAVLFAVPYFVDWNSYRGVFEEEASRVLGRDVRVGGAVNLHLLPAPYIGFEKVRISDTEAEGGNSIFRAESFTMWLSVPPLLRGVIEANQVELRRPVVQLAIDRQGGGNWRSLAFNQGSLPLVPKDVALQSVKIVDGVVTVSAADRGELAQFEAINGELSAEALEGPYKFRGTLKWSGAERSLRLATARRDPDGDVRFKASVDAPETGNSYLLDGRLSDISARPQFDGELTAKISLAPEPPPAKGATGGDAAAPPPPAPPAAVNPPAPGAEQAPPDKRASEPLDAAELQLTTPAVDAHGRPKFDLRAKLEGDGAGFRLDDITVTLEQGGPPQLITGSANLAWAEKMHLDVNLASRWLDLDVLMGMRTDTVPLEAARRMFEGLAAALPAEAETSATLAFDQLNLGGEAVSNVRLSASRTTGPLELKGLRANLPGGSRLELDGVLTPGQKAPKLDGTLAVAGQSLMRFLGWGFRHKTIAEGRSDGPFALEGRFALGDNRIELTEASAEFAGMPLSGDLKYDLGERKKISLALQGTRIDAAQFRPGILGGGALQSILSLAKPGVPDAGAKETETSPEGPFDPASTDLALKLRASELVDGARVLRDVQLEMAIDRGVLSLPALKFATPEGLVLEAQGEATDVANHARGSMRGLVQAPTPAAALAFLELLDLGADQKANVARFARLAPLRLAGSLNFPGSAAGAADLAVDGSVVGGGRMTARVRLGGGPGSWRSEPVDVTATLDAPSVERLFADSPPAPASGGDASAPAKPGRAVLKAAGIPATGLLSLLHITSDDFTADYNGRVALPQAGSSDITGTLAISARDARAALAIAGLRLGDGAADTALAGSVSVRAKDGALTLASDDLAIGASKVRGSLTLKDGEGGAREVTADLDIGTASIPGLMAPILAQAQALEPALLQRPSSAPPAQAKAGAPPAATVSDLGVGIWSEQPFDLSITDKLMGRVNARVHALTLEPGLTISDARLVAAIEPGSIKVESLEGDAVGGKLTSRLDFAKAPAGVTLNGSLRIDVSSGGKSGADAAGPGDIAALSLEFVGRALSPAALVGDLKGKGEVALGDTTLSGMSPGAVTAVAEAALAGKGPTGGEALSQAVKTALKGGQLQLGKIAIPIEIGDGAMKLGRVKIESAEGRSTFATAIELSTMKIDSEWQIEPKVARPTNPGERVLLPAVTVVYVGKLSSIAALEPVVTTGALERELQVRKMERDVDELERLRKLDQARARQEIEQQNAIEAERLRTAPPPPPAPDAADPMEQQVPLPPTAPPRPAAGMDPTSTDGGPQAASGPDDPAAAGVPGDATVGVPLPPPPGAEAAVPAEAVAPPRPRKKKPADAWSPFQNSPLSPF